jgi:hypothetical protein
LFCNATFSIYWEEGLLESIETKCEINLVDGVIVGLIIVKAKNRRYFRCISRTSD